MGDATWLAAATVIPVSHRALRQRKAGAVESSQARSGIAASYARYSSSLQSEDSLESQRRLCWEAAQQNGHEIRPELEFADEAQSGASQDQAPFRQGQAEYGWQVDLDFGVAVHWSGAPFSVGGHPVAVPLFLFDPFVPIFQVLLLQQSLSRVLAGPLDLQRPQMAYSVLR